jgi:hypothetical protein
VTRYYADGFPEAVDSHLAVFLVNEIITAVNERLAEGIITGVEDHAPVLPYFGTCRNCGAITYASHLSGPDSDICDDCWANGIR